MTSSPDNPLTRVLSLTFEEYTALQPTPLEQAIAARDEWRKNLGKKLFDAWFKQAISERQDEARYAAERVLEELEFLPITAPGSKVHRLTVKAALDAQQKSAEASALARAMLFAHLTPVQWS